MDWLGQSAQLSFDDSIQGGDDKNGLTENVQNWIYSGNITGILKQDKSDRDGLALMNLSSAKKILKENYSLAAMLNLDTDTYACALVYTKDIESVNAVIDKINGMGYEAAKRGN